MLKTVESTPNDKENRGRRGQRMRIHAVKNMLPLISRMIFGGRRKTSSQFKFLLSGNIRMRTKGGTKKDGREDGIEIITSLGIQESWNSSGQST